MTPKGGVFTGLETSGKTTRILWVPNPADKPWDEKEFSRSSAFGPKSGWIALNPVMRSGDPVKGTLPATVAQMASQVAHEAMHIFFGAPMGSIFGEALAFTFQAKVGFALGLRPGGPDSDYMDVAFNIANACPIILAWQYTAPYEVGLRVDMARLLLSWERSPYKNMPDYPPIWPPE